MIDRIRDVGALLRERCGVAICAKTRKIESTFDRVVSAECAKANEKFPTDSERALLRRLIRRDAGGRFGVSKMFLFTKTSGLFGQFRHFSDALARSPVLIW
ncbi:hypothetical protein [Sphingomonas sp. UYEF23]|uniref:hypothetical protein n=1 Tax=Sphingomonas sp. UYEF23 TaxID=1756408 RepID=UPI003391EBCB